MIEPSRVMAGRSRYRAVASSLAVAGWLLTAAVANANDRQGMAFFESKIRPLLVEHCYDCHSQESGEASGGLRLDNADAMLRGGSLGPAIVPGKPESSLLLKAVRYRDSDLQMPPGGKLDDEAIESLHRWIVGGAPDPRQATSGEGAASEQTPSPLDRDPSTHWAFVPPQPADPPEQIADDSRDLVDALAAEWSDREGLARAAEADPETLIRRLYFDLTGLPPEYGEIRRFVDSDRPDAYRRLVDRLLASPEFAERFARHWLDVARYADTIGYTTGGKERRLQGSERFRDWTIDAFAADMPYDEMIRHQLAGDRTDPDNADGNLDAMGFLTVGRRYLSRNDTTDDRIDVITRGLLGLTVACARCHDHKFDPIPTADYYSLFGILRSSKTPGGGPSPLRMVDRDNPRDFRVLRRGQRGSHGDVAPRQYFTALREPDAAKFNDGSGRWELAERIAADDNPLTARVMVNRLWGHLIRRHLVGTPSDFGVRTEPPAVPGILDDLAAEFSEHWSIKRVVRRIVLSRIYRQSAEVPQATREGDPDNRLLTRANRRRRDFESLRDSMLAVCGQLEREIGGSPVEITSPTPVPRRTIYAMIDRQNLPQLFRTFDFASPDAHAPKRHYTTVPQQALFLLNNRQMFELARAAADRVRREADSGDRAAQVETLFRRVLGRRPDRNELRAMMAFLEQPATTPEEIIDPRSLWSYGVIDTRGEVPENFRPLKVFDDKRWQGGKEYPTEGKLGYASLGRENGHPGHDASVSVVRRWTAPATGTIKITGVMGHRSEQGDGVIASIWVGGRRVFRERQKSSNRPYGPIRAEVNAGETVDFVADPGESASYDGFFWRTRISLSGDGEVIAADSRQDFSGPFDPQQIEPLDRLAQLAQVLLISNEFAFID